MGLVREGHRPARVFVPFTTKSTSQALGAGVIAGATADTDLGLAIPSTGQFVNQIGWLRSAVATASTTDSVVAGTTWVFQEIELSAYAMLQEAEYDQTVANAVAVASTSGTTVTITNLEDNIDCSWLYAVSGTGSGKLAFLTASAAGSATTKTATGWDSTTKVIKIHRFGGLLLDIQTGATLAGKIKSAAAAPTGTVFVFETKFEDVTHTKTLLNPTIHDNLTLTNPRFTATFAIKGQAGF